mmetsp:Transcript_9591/g.13203  ORF Transcript_9591/g.13203 Transcript_9591/m.13203 type:complete len:356 (+) Transcript_9591:128-1195(+)
MGNCGSNSSGGNKQDNKQNQDINKYLRDEKKKLDSEVKLLLLGAGESGKSTIAKQMRIIHLEGFPESERLTYKSIIFNNVYSSMKALVNACNDLKIQISPNNMAAAHRIADDLQYFTGTLTKDIASDIKALWADEGIKRAFERQNEFQLNDSAGYYFNAIDRLSADNYVPTEQDVLRSRAKTTGIIETEFVVEKTKFKLVDVGGQRSERKKWMHCFQDVTAVIFCVAMSEYDLKLYEDDTTNRMHESLKLFKEICNSRWFIDTSMILFLNKKDLFQDKIKKIDLNVCFEDYKGGKNYESASEFIKEKFVNQNENPKKHIYVHFTQATDTKNVEVVFNAVKDIILHQVLDDSGLAI